MLNSLKNYTNNARNDINYITPIEYYNIYYEKNDHLLIDLRQKDDYEKFHIKNAINIFWLDLLNDENLNFLNKYPKDKKIFLICYSGHTSSQSLVLLKLLGYKNTISIKFGYGSIIIVCFYIMNKFGCFCKVKISQ